MKKISLDLKTFYGVLGILIVVFFTSCKKYDSLGFTPGSGAPSISSVHTWSATDTTVMYDTIITYDNAGNATQTLKQKNAQVNPFDSVTNAGSLGNYYVIYGSNLGSVSAITFNGLNAYFNRALITDNSIVVQIPSKTPYYGDAATDSLVVTTLHGKAYYKFSIIAPPPTVEKVSDYDFWSGSQITLNGVGFINVSSVGLVGSSAQCTIVDKNDSTLVLQFPTTDVNSANLVFSYSSNGDTKTLNSTQVFNDLDNAYTIFYKDNFQNSWEDNSWSHPSGLSTEASHSGTASIRANYPAGGWQIEGWQGWNGPNGGFPYNADYKYLTFWVKGGVATHTLVLVGDKMAGGYGQVQNANAYAAQLVTVPAGVWTYFKIPLSAPSGTNPNLLNYWATGNLAQQLGFFLQGMDGDVDEVLYFDEVAFLK